MAYNLRRFVEYTDREDVVQRAELLELDYSGPSAEILTSDGIQFEHEELTTSGRVYKLYENPILKGTLDLNLIIETAADEQLIQDIVNSDEDQFRIVWKQDGVKFWEGTLLNDLIEYSELPLQAKQPVPITAKDLSSLEADDYAFADNGRGKIIEIIAEILNTLGYGNNIVSVTSWTSASVTQSDDFLNTHYIDRFPLQDYARTGNETNEPLTNWEALQKICQDFKLILKQLDGVWFLVQYSAYEDPSSVRQFVYNSDGIQQSATTVNAVGNGSTIIKGKSRTNPYPGLKSARVSYKHRLKSTNIQFPDLIELDPVNNLQQSFTQLFISDGGQSVRLSGLAQAETADTISEFALYFVYVIEAGGYYWDAVNQVWTTSFVSNEEDMVDTYSTGGKLGWERSFNINTTTAPADADGDLIVTLYIARNDTDGVADYTDFINLGIKIIGAQADENSEYIDYELVQAGAYSTKMELPDAYYGDGPTSFARSAISTDAAGTQFTADQWRRRGQALSLNFHHNSLKEVIDPQRSGIKRSEAQTEGLYNPRLITPYRGSNYIYVGGVYNGDTWEPVLAEVKIQTASDTFSDLPKFVDSALSSDPGTTNGSVGGGDGGLTETAANSLYLKIASNGSDIDDIVAFRNAIGINQGVSTDDAPTFTGLTLNGNVTAESGYLWIKNGVSYLSGGAIVGSSAVPTYDFEVEGNSEFRGWVRVNNDYLQVDDRVGIGNAPYGPNRIGNSELQVDGSVDVTGSIGFIDDSATQASSWRMYQGGNIPLLIAKNFASSFAVVDVKGLGVDPSDQTKNSEATLALFRGTTDEVDSEFMDLFNNGYWNQGTALAESVYMGVRVQKRGVGEYRPFKFQYSDGTSVIDMFRMNPPDGDNNVVFDVPLLINNSVTIKETGVKLSVGNETTEFVRVGGGATIFSHDVEIDGTNSLTVGGELIAKNTATFEKNVLIQGGLFAKEFVVNTTQVLSDFAMSNGGKVASVSGSDGDEVVTFEDENGSKIEPFAVNDILHIQVTTGTSLGTIVKNIWRYVVSIDGSSNYTLGDSGDDQNFSWSGLQDDEGSIAVGDDVVRKGNTTNSNRDHYIKFDISGVGGVAVPFVGLFDGIDDVEDTNGTQGDTGLRLGYGNLNGRYGITSDEFGFGVGDSDLQNNHIVLTPSTTKVRLDTFLFDVGLTASKFIVASDGIPTDVNGDGFSRGIFLGARDNPIYAPEFANAEGFFIGELLNGNFKFIVGNDTGDYIDFEEGIGIDIVTSNYKLSTPGLEIDSSGPSIIIGTGGEISNSTADFLIDESGFSIPTTTSYEKNSAYLVGGSIGTTGALWGDSNSLYINTFQGYAITLLSEQGGDITINARDVDADLILRAARHIIMNGLPASDPGTANALWADASGYLRIS